ncbi:hypothetical protein GGF46_002807 [Coemansia sp. RSA 552]|nr:hypothetical protein GGF46_002807 [Coemansia sp. RSA 552]
MATRRRKPLSGKERKAQLQSKRAQRRERAEWDDPEWDFSHHPPAAGPPQPSPDPPQPPAGTPHPPAELPGPAELSTGDGRNRLTSQFDKLTRAEIEANKKRSMQPLCRRDAEDGLTMSFDDAYSADVDIPVRPPWQHGESKERVEAREEAYFSQWLAGIQGLRDSQGPDSVSLYERNLEVWRQLWRVVEISDVLLLVVDIRHPVLHFPPSLYRYVAETTGKPIVVVMNKTDLVADTTVRAWMHYFKQTFPSVVLTTFCCYRDPTPLVNDTTLADMKMKKKKPRRRVYDSSQVGDLFSVCRDVCDTDKQNLVDWDSLIARYTAAAEPADGRDEMADSNSGDDGGDDGHSDAESAAGAASDHGEEVGGSDEPSGEQASRRHVTLGLVGHPNVGKSTIINSIVQRSVVSTSRTPGHTKHFQTIHVTPTLRLCDCPGLVFPCKIGRPLQVLAGLYNIAQVQEPYTSVQFLAERIPLERVLALQPPTATPGDPAGLLDGVGYRWSAWAICEAFAIERGFLTPRAVATTARCRR